MSKNLLFAFNSFRKSLKIGGSLFIGELGTMVLPHVGMPKLYPADKFAG